MSKQNSSVEVGEEVRISLGNGSYLRGAVQTVDSNGVIVRGRKFPFSSVETADEVADAKEQNIRSLREEEQVRAAEMRPRKPSGAPLDLSGLATSINDLKVDVRLYWQDHYDALAQEWARDYGVPVDGCVPNVFGVRGGTVPQWGICGKVTIEIPNDQTEYAKIMRELSEGDSVPQVVDGNIVVNGYRVAAGMAKAGFPVHS